MPVDLTSVKKSAPKQSASGKTHPALPDEDGILAKHVSNTVACKEQIETLEANLMEELRDTVTKRALRLNEERQK